MEKQPLKFGVLFGVGGFLYSFGFTFFASDGGIGVYICFFSLLLASYLFLAIISLVAIFANLENTLTKRLMIAGFIGLVLSSFSLQGNLFIISIILLYPSLSLFMLGFHYLFPSPDKFSRYIGLILAISISFLGIILYAAFFYEPYIEQTVYLFLLPALLSPILCILSGYHSSKMLSEVDNHDKM